MKLYNKGDFPGRDLTSTDASVVRMLIELGFPHHKIAALFDTNLGRISKVNTGQRHSMAPTIEALYT